MEGSPFFLIYTEKYMLRRKCHLDIRVDSGAIRGGEDTIYNTVGVCAMIEQKTKCELRRDDILLGDKYKWMECILN